MDRLCFECQHFGPVQHGPYSEVTPDVEYELVCKKAVFQRSIEINADSNRVWAECVRKAATCTLFEPAPWARRE